MLEGNTGLQSLMLSLESPGYCKNESAVASFISQAVAFLLRIHPDAFPTLREINLRVCDYVLHETYMKIFNPALCTMLDNYFSHPRFSALQVVSFSVNVDLTVKDGSPDKPTFLRSVRDQFESQFPQLRERTLVEYVHLCKPSTPFFACTDPFVL